METKLALRALVWPPMISRALTDSPCIPTIPSETAYQAANPKTHLEESTMELLTAELRARLPALYSQEGNQDPVVHLKFFTPDSNWTWFVTEGSEDEEDFRFFWVRHWPRRRMGLLRALGTGVGSGAIRPGD
jgi:hypothetical protein